MSGNHFFSGAVRFTVFGLPIGCLNKLRQFKPEDITIYNDTISFTVQLVYALQVKKLVSNFEWQMKENYNLFRGANFLLNKMVLAVSVLVCVIAFFIFDMGVYDIRVVGVSSELTGDVYNYLDELGVKKFITKQKVTNMDIAAGIVTTFPNVAHANVRLSGNTLVVSVIEAESNPMKQMSNIYAKYDAVIKEVIAFSGRAMVEFGDVVRKGDLLVENAYPDTVSVIGEVAFISGGKIIRLDISII